MLSIDPLTLSVADLHQHIIGAVSPRPIAFVSTLSENGVANLAPYSFFNAFSSNPPILVFSSNRRVANNTTKDTLHNVEATGECVVNIVNYSMVRQMAIASVEYAPEVNEFEKAGFTPLASEIVKPFRVAESPIHLECKVTEIIPLGDKGGAGHLIVCQVVRLHLSEDILSDKGRIDPFKLDAVARMGRAYYARINGDAIFSLHQPVNVEPVGYDKLPKRVLNSRYLTAYDVSRLAALPADTLPTPVELLSSLPEADEVVSEFEADPARLIIELHALAKGYLDNDEVETALKILLLAEQVMA